LENGFMEIAAEERKCPSKMPRRGDALRWSSFKEVISMKCGSWLTRFNSERLTRAKVKRKGMCCKNNKEREKEGK
jgi:hypothetical protein